jgi:peroxiredoxin
MAARRVPKLLSIGSIVPNVSLPHLKGGDVRLPDLTSGAPALLAFFKVSCPVCQLTLPFLDRIHTAGALPVYAISQNDPEDTREFNRDFRISLPTLLDDERAGFIVSNAFGISTVPTTFLVEPGGAISHVLEGWRKKEIEALGRRAGTVVIRPGDDVPEWKAG